MPLCPSCWAGCDSTHGLIPKEFNQAEFGHAELGQVAIWVDTDWSHATNTPLGAEGRLIEELDIRFGGGHDRHVDGAQVEG